MLIKWYRYDKKRWGERGERRRLKGMGCLPSLAGQIIC